MKAISHVEGRVAVLDRPDVDTDQIIPKQFLKRIERTGYGQYAFFDWRFDEDGNERPGFELNQPQFAGARILLAGRNFGCGSSREHAAWALQDYGLDVIIAPSFGDIFRSNAAQTGIVLVELPEEQVKELMESVDLDRGSELVVDLEALTVTTPAGKVLPFEFDESTRYRLLNGLDDIGITLQHDDEITAYETRPTAHRSDRTLPSCPGDGIGPEVAAEAIRVLDALGIGHSEHAFGGNAILAQGDPLPAETLAACREADAVLLAAVGLPELEGQAVRPEQGLLGLRKELGVYANLRPARAPGIDMMIVRELVGGLYFGAKGTRDDGTWFDTCEYSRPEVERIARRGFEIAAERGGRLTSVDKVNVMHTSRLWRDVVSELGAEQLPRRAARSRARRLVRDDDRPGAGDDRHRRDREHVRRHPLGRRRRRDRRPRARRLGLARGRGAGDLRAGPRLGAADRRPGDREPGGDAAVGRAAPLPRLGRFDEATALERAVDIALAEAPTPDLGGTSTTRDVGDAVLRALDAARTL